MQAILLAAGFGTRLKPYTTLRPKPLFPVQNKPLLHILLQKLRQAGCTRIIVNAHHLATQVAAALEGWEEAILQYEPEILGTGGSLRCALPKLENAPVLVVNGDVYQNIDLASLYRHHLQAVNGVTLALHDFPRFNTVEVKDGLVRSFAGTGCCLAFTGIQVVNPEIIAQIPSRGFFHIIDLYEQLATHGKINFHRVDGAFWRDMGTPEDYLLLNKELQNKAGERWLIAGDAQIGKNVRLRGWGCIGPKAVIAEGCELQDSVVWDGAHIPANSKEKNAILTGNPMSFAPAR